MDRPARFTVGAGYTAFVGANNAGKTSALRFFYEFRPLFQRLTPGSGNLIQMLAADSHDTPGLLGVIDPLAVFHSGNELDIEVRLTLETPAAEAPVPVPVPVPAELVLHMNRNGQARVLIPGSDPFPQNQTGWDSTFITVAGAKRFDFAPWFEIFAAMAQTLFIGAFRNALNVGGGAHYDLAIGEQFVQTWDRYKAGDNRREIQAALDLTEEIRRIFEFESLEINAHTANKSLLVIIDGRPYPLDEVGGGLAHFIIALASAAIQRPQLILIDEPELNPHPSLQLDFLTTLGRYASKGTLFATHSIGLVSSSS